MAAVGMAMATAMVTDALKNSQYFGVNGTGTGDAALKISHYFFFCVCGSAAAATEQKSVDLYIGFSIISTCALRKVQS